MKQYKYLIIAVFIILFTPVICFADLCTTNKYNALKDKIKDIEIKWEFVEEEKQYKFTFKNVDPLIMVYYNDKYYESNDNKEAVIYTSAESGNEYGFKLYGSYDSSCIEEYLDTKNITVTKYNPYSEKEECKDNEDFELCKKLYDGEIKGEEEFEDKLTDYRNETTIKNLIIFSTVVILVTAIAIILLRRGKKGVKNEE